MEITCQNRLNCLPASALPCTYCWQSAQAAPCLVLWPWSRLTTYTLFGQHFLHPISLTEQAQPTDNILHCTYQTGSCCSCVTMWFKIPLFRVWTFQSYTADFFKKMLIPTSRALEMLSYFAVLSWSHFDQQPSASTEQAMVKKKS